MFRHYTTKEIREFIACPQFGNLKYGRWGSLRLEVRETLLNLINLVESMDSIIQQKYNIIEEVREYITTIKDEDIQYSIGWVKQDILEILDKENK